MTLVKKRKLHNRDDRAGYLLDMAQKLDIDLSIANEVETRRILNKLPNLSGKTIKNRHH